MTISISCKCGRKINAADKYAGKKVRCPDCNDIIQVPEQPPTALSTSDNIIVKCNCGKQISAKPELAGKAVRCPGCQNVVRIPVSNPESKPQSLSDDSGNLTLRCSCGKQFAVKSELAGKAVRCPGCQKVVRIPIRKSERIPQSLEDSPEPLHDDFFGLDDESDPLEDSVTLSNMAPGKRRRGRKGDSFDLKWIYWSFGSAAALIIVMSVTKSLKSITSKVPQSVERQSMGPTSPKDKEKRASMNSQNASRKPSNRTRSTPNGKKYLKPVPEVEEIINEVVKRAAVNEADRMLQSMSLRIGIKKITALDQKKIIRGMEYYVFDSRLGEILGKSMANKAGGYKIEGSLRDKIVITLYFRNYGDSSYDPIRVDGSLRESFLREILNKSENTIERANALRFLAHRYERKYRNEKKQKAKLNALRRAKSLVPIQRNFLESRNESVWSNALGATTSLKRLAAPNRDAIESALKQMTVKPDTEYVEYIIDHLSMSFGSRDFDEY